MSLKEYLAANMFDGCDTGLVTLNLSTLLDDIAGNVAEWFIQASGTDEHLLRYYTEEVG